MTLICSGTYFGFHPKHFLIGFSKKGGLWCRCRLIEDRPTGVSCHREKSRRMQALLSGPLYSFVRWYSFSSLIHISTGTSKTESYRHSQEHIQHTRYGLQACITI